MESEDITFLISTLHSPHSTLSTYVLYSQLVRNRLVRRDQRVAPPHGQRRVADRRHQLFHLRVEGQHVIDDLLRAAVHVESLDEARILRADARRALALSSGIAAPVLGADADL